MKQLNAVNIIKFFYTRARVGACIVFISTGFAFADAVSDLSSTNEFVRAKAVHSLGESKDSSKLSNLTSLFSTESSKLVKMHLVKAIGRLGGATAVTALQTAIGDSDPDVRAAAIRELGKLSPATLDSQVNTLFSDTNDDVRMAAAVATKSSSGLVELLQAARSEDAAIRVKALTALAEHHREDSEVRTLLRSALTDADPKVKAAAQWLTSSMGIEVNP